MIRLSVHDFERTVDLLQQHDAENLVRKRWLPKGKAEIRPGKHGFGMAERTADRKGNAAFARAHPALHMRGKLLA